MATTDSASLDTARMTRAQRAALPLSADVAQALVEQHGVCIRPLAMRRIDTTTGGVDIVPVPCGSTREDQCPPCAERPAGCEWPNAARAGTSTLSPSPTGLRPVRSTRR
jgi:hypothetical protein